jgi:hypothetical protein
MMQGSESWIVKGEVCGSYHVSCAFKLRMSAIQIRNGILSKSGEMTVTYMK